MDYHSKFITPVGPSMMTQKGDPYLKCSVQKYSVLNFITVNYSLH